MSLRPRCGPFLPGGAAALPQTHTVGGKPDGPDLTGKYRISATGVKGMSSRETISPKNPRKKGFFAGGRSDAAGPRNKKTGAGKLEGRAGAEQPVQPSDLGGDGKRVASPISAVAFVMARSTVSSSWSMRKGL